MKRSRLSLSWLSVRELRRRVRRLAPALDDAGVSTLEIVVIAVGLFAVATLLVAGINAAVNSRLAEIG